MRKASVLVLSLVLALGALAPSALAGRCSDFGGCGSGGAGGGTRYTQRDSGLWVPTYTQRSEPVAAPTVRKFGEELGRDLAKDAVKGAVVYSVAVTWRRATSAVKSAWRNMPAAQRARLPMMPVK